MRPQEASLSSRMRWRFGIQWMPALMIGIYWGGEDRVICLGPMMVRWSK